MSFNRLEILFITFYFSLSATCSAWSLNVRGATLAKGNTKPRRCLTCPLAGINRCAVGKAAEFPSIAGSRRSDRKPPLPCWETETVTFAAKCKQPTSCCDITARNPADSWRSLDRKNCVFFFESVSPRVLQLIRFKEAVRKSKDECK
jgi:hypothetical protein